MASKFKSISGRGNDNLYRYTTKDGATVYYIKLRNIDTKQVWHKVGKESDGVTLPYCRTVRNQLLAKISNGEDIRASKNDVPQEVQRFHDLALQYFSDKVNYNKSASKTQSSYEKCIYTDIGVMPIEEINRAVIIALQKKLLDRGKAPKTVNWYIQLIGAIFNHALSRELISMENPVSRIQHIPHDNKRLRFLSVAETKTLLQAVSDDPMLLLFTKLCLTTGARLESVLSIRPMDIDFSRQSILIQDIKNKDTYWAMLRDDVKELLKVAIEDISPEQPVISIPNRTVSRKMKKILDALFNEHLPPRDHQNRVVIHTLRHTFASHLAINGTPINVIQKLLNHKRIETTMRYAKLLPDSGFDAVEKLYQD